MRYEVWVADEIPAEEAERIAAMAERYVRVD
jgi:hypothetical protein